MLWIWVPLALGAAAIELHTGALAGACVAGAAVAAGLFSGMGAPPAVQAMVFVGMGLALFGVVRPLIVRQRTHQVHRPEMLVGKFGTVLDDADEQVASGRVSVEGAAYVARSAPGMGPLPVGVMVRVRGVDSGELVVSRL